MCQSVQSHHIENTYTLSYTCILQYCFWSNWPNKNIPPPLPPDWRYSREYGKGFHRWMKTQSPILLGKTPQWGRRARWLAQHGDPLGWLKDGRSMPPALADHTTCPGVGLLSSNRPLYDFVLCSVDAEVGSPQIISANCKSANLQPYFLFQICGTSANPQNIIFLLTNISLNALIQI